MTLLTIVQGCSRIIPYSCMKCSNSCTDTPKKGRRSLGLQEMKGESGQKQWEYNKRNIKKTLVYVLLGLISGSWSCKTTKNKFLVRGAAAGQGCRRSWMSCTDRGAQLCDPDLLTGQPAVTHALSSVRQQKLKVTQDRTNHLFSQKKQLNESQVGTMSRVES